MRPQNIHRVTDGDVAGIVILCGLFAQIACPLPFYRARLWGEGKTRTDIGIAPREHPATPIQHVNNNVQKGVDNHC